MVAQLPKDFNRKVTVGEYTLNYQNVLKTRRR